VSFLYPERQPEIPPVIYVPRSREEVTVLVGCVVEAFWENRRYGELWQEGVLPQTGYFGGEEEIVGDSVLTTAVLGMNSARTGSRKVFKQLIFDLTAEILLDLYHEERTSKWIGVLLISLL